MRSGASGNLAGSDRQWESRISMDGATRFPFANQVPSAPDAVRFLGRLKDGWHFPDNRDADKASPGTAHLPGRLSPFVMGAFFPV